MSQEDNDIAYRKNSAGSIGNEEVEKLAQIAETMELLEETHKSKEWILEQIRQNRVKIPRKPGMSLVGILKACPTNFISHLIDLMNLGELEEFEGPPPLTVTYHWFFTDIVAGSDPTITTNEQARKIIVLNQLIDRTQVFRERDPESTLVLPTGDGMAIGFSDSPEKPLRLALEVHKNIWRYNSLKKYEKDKLYIRVGIDTGPVYLIKDLNGKENVWGPGIIMARRVMDLARDMNIIASARIANDIRPMAVMAATLEASGSGSGGNIGSTSGGGSGGSCASGAGGNGGGIAGGGGGSGTGNSGGLVGGSGLVLDFTAPTVGASSSGGTPTSGSSGTRTPTATAPSSTRTTPSSTSPVSTTTAVTSVSPAITPTSTTTTGTSSGKLLPIVKNLTAATNESQPVVILLQGSDRGGKGTMTYSLITGPTHGSLSPITGASVTYTPSQNVGNTVDSFTYRASDGAGLSSNVGTVTIKINAAGTAP